MREQPNQENTPSEVSIEREPADIDRGLSPLARAELTAIQVAQSTGEAVQRLAKDTSLLKHTPANPHSTAEQTVDSSQLSALEMAQNTAERVARSTGEALRTLTHDFAARTQGSSRFPNHVRNGDLEASSEPSLLTGGGYSALPARLTDRFEQRSSLQGMNGLGVTEGKTSTPQQEGRVGLQSFHRSLGSLSFEEGLSPLDKVIHTAEKVAGSTGVAVVKLSDSLTTTP